MQADKLAAVAILKENRRAGAAIDAYCRGGRPSLRTGLPIAVAVADKAGRAPNNSLMLTRLAGVNAMGPGQRSSHTMKVKSPSRRAA
jgi:hypothetical protein